MGTRYELSDKSLVIGRGADCDIRINDHSVSRRHARIQPGADGYYAVDLQSTNGTYINDIPASMFSRVFISRCTCNSSCKSRSTPLRRNVPA